MENRKDKAAVPARSCKTLPPSYKIAVSGLIMAVYVLVMYFTQGFAFGEYQIRIATSLYALSAIYPFLIIPLGLSNFISNTIMGGFGFFDMVGGLIIGLVTAALTWLVKKLNLNDWFIAVPVILGPGLVVPIWMAPLLGIPYTVLALSVCIGQIIPGILGVILVKQLRGKIK